MTREYKTEDGRKVPYYAGEAFAERMNGSVEYFIQDAMSSVEPSEMNDDNCPSWLGLLNRLGEEKVEEMFERLTRDFSEYSEYHSS